jgi:hypothetical protein
MHAKDVDGRMMGLNEYLGIMLAPVRTIFLVGLGDGFLRSGRDAMQG